MYHDTCLVELYFSVFNSKTFQASDHLQASAFCGISPANPFHFNPSFGILYLQTRNGLLFKPVFTVQKRLSVFSRTSLLPSLARMH
ncbi:hypothetical protein VNO77_36581 [Canavalia gladiata]|uniref:Uncharacterized protein n=1 Tax=Canavalia gladiata TaxID=3824 RepID=A0AAN9PUE3_CANGL